MITNFLLITTVVFSLEIRHFIHEQHFEVFIIGQVEYLNSVLKIKTLFSTGFSHLCYTWLNLLLYLISFHNKLSKLN